MLFDAHTHLTEGKAPSAGLMYQLAVGSSPQECAYLDRLCAADPLLFRACGVHPWHSAEIPVDDLTEWMETYPVVGEIGMDSVWCDVDPTRQRRVFVRQLEWAAEHGKPVVLHTKGCEKEVLAELSGFPHPILVHWYSCQQYLPEYIRLGCYFTVGPDLETNPAVQLVALHAPMDRLMVESDGADGASWCLGRRVSPDEIPQVLTRTIHGIAAVRGIAPYAVANAVLENALAFVGGNGSAFS